MPSPPSLALLLGLDPPYSTLILSRPGHRHRRLPWHWHWHWPWPLPLPP